MKCNVQRSYTMSQMLQTFRNRRDICRFQIKGTELILQSPITCKLVPVMIFLNFVLLSELYIFSGTHPFLVEWLLLIVTGIIKYCICSYNAAVTTIPTVCTAKRLLASLLLPSIICLIVTFILSIALKDVGKCPICRYTYTHAHVRHAQLNVIV